jgi:hypothetical protein
MANPANIIIPNSWTPRQRAAKRLQSFEAPGKRSGKTAGSHMDELWTLHKAIWLCWECKHKFDHVRHRYFYEKNLRVNARCDGCGEHRQNSHLFIHESTVVQNGKSRHGDSWRPQ